MHILTMPICRVGLNSVTFHQQLSFIYNCLVHIFVILSINDRLRMRSYHAGMLFIISKKLHAALDWKWPLFPTASLSVSHLMWCPELFIMHITAPSVHSSTHTVVRPTQHLHNTESNVFLLCTPAKDITTMCHVSVKHKYCLVITCIIQSGECRWQMWFNFTNLHHHITSQNTLHYHYLRLKSHVTNSQHYGNAIQ